MGVVPKPRNVLKTVAGSSQAPCHIAFKPPSLKSEILENVFPYQNKKIKEVANPSSEPSLGISSTLHIKSYKHIVCVCAYTRPRGLTIFKFQVSDCVCRVCVMRNWDLEQSKLPSVCREPGSVRWDHVMANQCAGTAIGQNCFKTPKIKKTRPFP